MAQGCGLRLLRRYNGDIPQFLSQSTKGLHNFKTHGGRLGIGMFSNILEVWTQLIAIDHRRCLIPNSSLVIAPVVSSLESTLYTDSSGDRFIHRSADTYRSCYHTW
jgi:hypothetical protein